MKLLIVLFALLAAAMSVSGRVVNCKPVSDPQSGQHYIVSELSGRSGYQYNGGYQYGPQQPYYG